MKRKKIIKLIDTAGRMLDHFNGAVAKSNLPSNVAECVCTKDEIRAMQTALSCCARLLEDEDASVDAMSFVSKMLAVHTILKAEYQTEGEPVTDSDAND